jgi:hypothetical protein
MAPLLRILFQLSWFLGVLNIIIAVVVKLLRAEQTVHVTAHTLFLVASTFFLCALATREMQRGST